MLARAVLTVIAHPATRPPQPADEHLIPLTLNEIRRLFAKLIIDTVHTVAHRLCLVPDGDADQTQAKTSHYRVLATVSLANWTRFGHARGMDEAFQLEHAPRWWRGLNGTPIGRRKCGMVP